MNSIEWILNYSETAKLYKDDVTILCWICSNENGCFLSSIDLHYQFLLQEQFHHIEAMVVHVSGNSINDFECFQLNRDGHRQLSGCYKKPGKTHAACGKFEFYEKACYDFNDLTLKISDFREYSYVDKPMKNLDGKEVVTDVFYHHSNEAQLFECEDCLKSFQTPEALSIHIANEHVMDMDDNEATEIEEEGKKSETSEYIFDDE